MKLLDIIGHNKTVQYFGMELQVPAFTNWLAVDANGELYAYEHTPRYYTAEQGVWDRLTGRIAQLTDVDLEGLDWTETLREM